MSLSALSRCHKCHTAHYMKYIWHPYIRPFTFWNLMWQVWRFCTPLLWVLHEYSCQHKRLNFPFFPPASFFTWELKISILFCSLSLWVPSTGKQCKSSWTEVSRYSIQTEHKRQWWIGSRCHCQLEEWPSNRASDCSCSSSVFYTATTNTCNQREMEALNSKEPEELEAVSYHPGGEREADKAKTGCTFIWDNHPFSMPGIIRLLPTQLICLSSELYEKILKCAGETLFAYTVTECLLLCRIIVMCFHSTFMKDRNLLKPNLPYTGPDCWSIKCCLLWFTSFQSSMKWLKLPQCHRAMTPSVPPRSCCQLH